MAVIKGQFVTAPPKDDRNCKSDYPESVGLEYLSP
jgi:hypothetical protein